MAPCAGILRWRALIQFAPMAEDDLAYRIVSFVSVGVKNGVHVNGS